EIAVVGNVLTNPAHRNRGLAKLATSAVTAALLQRCPQVFLTVESTNIPALKVYDALGYRESCTLYETPVTRREPMGTLALWRRTLARWRGRREGVEVVVRR
ncbi:MAG: GNAT family N-acetyltransferase, partial [Dehalococcoidia bacterium]